MAGGEDGPGDAEGQDAWGGVAGYEDVFEAEAEVKGEIGPGDDITDAEAGRGAREFLIHFGAVGIVEGVAVGVEFGDVGCADAGAAKGFDIESGAAVIEGMTIAEQERNEDHMGLTGREIIESDLTADLITFRYGKTDMQITAESGG